MSLGTKQGRFSALTSLSYRKRDAYALKDKEGQIEYSYYKDIYGRDSVVADTSEKGMSSVNGFEIWQANQKLSYTFNENFRISLMGHIIIMTCWSTWSRKNRIAFLITV